ncbi:hemerythrin domain-containing protein [Thiolapillus sp.]
MKRSLELTTLSREHHQSLRLANHCLNIAAAGDREQCRALCQHILRIFDEELDPHFRKEEASIFNITAAMGGEIHDLGLRLAEEHEQMRAMAAKMGQGDCGKLAAFGKLLKEHTRLEERKLFPLVEAQFSNDQLAQIQEKTQDSPGQHNTCYQP